MLRSAGQEGDRRRRNRERNRPERAARGEGAEANVEALAVAPAASEPAPAAPVAELNLPLPTPSTDTGPFSVAPAQATLVEPLAPLVPAVEPAVVAEAAPAPVAEPVVAAVAAPFVLPMSELQAIAQNAGLEWVNSDADKIRVVQEAIANEPKPVHVPRERKPPVVLHEGPLILVETRKDLSEITLPFEQPQQG